MSISDEEQANSWKGLSNITDRLDKLIVLMETQAQYMRPVPVADPDLKREKEEDGPTSVFQEVSEHLRKIHERQTAIDMVSKQPLPQTSATSASAWGALLRSHLNNAEPIISQWRGTLDTILIFVALFSAIVTALYVQSLTNLAPDTGERTNELLQNLTEVIIVLQGASAAQFDFSRPTVFTPATGVVRLNFYFSISLVLSISIAALAVTSRGYVAMLTRSKHRKAHKKLGELHQRWVAANRLLAPAIEALPQLLIIPVLLFIVGLLDMLLSSSIPLSGSDELLLAAGIISCVFITGVGVYTIWTVVHGCIHSETSPYQSTLSRVLVTNGPYWLKIIKRVSSMCITLWGRITQKLARVKNNYLLPIFREQRSGTDAVSHQHSLVVAQPTQTHAPTTYKTVDYHGKDDDVAMHEHMAFHTVLYQTHDDDVLDHAAAILLSLSKSRHPKKWQLVKDDHGKPSASPLEIATILYLLSDEASIRSNLTAAADICLFQSFGESCGPVLERLMKAGRRYSYHLTGSEISHELWNCPFTRALCHITFFARDDYTMFLGLRAAQREELVSKAPIVGILLASLEIRSGRVSSQSLHLATFLISYALNVLDASMKVRRRHRSDYSFDRLESVLRNSGALSFVDGLTYDGFPYPLPQYRDNDGEHIDIWDHPLLSVLSTGFFTCDVTSGPSLAEDEYIQIHIALLFVKWYVERYYHSLQRPPSVKLSSAVRWILRVYLVDMFQWHEHIPRRHELFGESNVLYLDLILDYHRITFVSAVSSIRPVMLHAESGGFLQSTAEVVNFVYVTDKRRPWSSERCQSCGKEVTTGVNAPRPSSFCCLKGIIMKSLRALHEHTPFVRLTSEETQLLRERLSNPQGGLPAHHKTTPHSEKVRHILLKSFLRFAPDVPVLSHHYKRRERFGVDDSFMKIDWEWMETSDSELASPDPIDSAD